MGEEMTVEIFEDEAQRVKKLVFDFGDAVAEAVLYRYPTYEERTVICCSVMSGCPIGCRFCGTGDYFVRNLTAAEILEQVETCLKETQVDPAKIKKLQIMTMSMGEPLLNLKQLNVAIRTLHVIYPNAALLVSTSGPSTDKGYVEFTKLSMEVPTVGLQFSIHESTDEARNKLIPFKAKLSLRRIAKIGEVWNDLTGRKPFFNYCAHEGNSTIEDAQRLRILFNPEVWNATVSVICERDSSGMLKSNDHQRDLASEFSSKLVDLGYDVRVFDPAGQDTIGGGCGQLWFVQDWMKNNPDKARPSCGNGKEIRHIPIKEV